MDTSSDVVNVGQTSSKFMDHLTSHYGLGRLLELYLGPSPSKSIVIVIKNLSQIIGLVIFAGTNFFLKWWMKRIFTIKNMLKPPHDAV